MNSREATEVKKWRNYVLEKHNSICRFITLINKEKKIIENSGCKYKRQ